MARRRKWTPRSTIVPSSSRKAAEIGYYEGLYVRLNSQPPSEAMITALRQTRYGFRSRRRAVIGA